jgi:hypothetical protein
VVGVTIEIPTNRHILRAIPHEAHSQSHLAGRRPRYAFSACH